MVARDTQRRKVYRWERAFVPHDLWHTRITEAVARQLAGDVSRHYNMAIPALVVRRLPGTVAGQYWGSRHLIDLDLHEGLNRGVVLHELAHAVHAMRSAVGTYPGGHGPEFMLWYLDILDRFAGLTMEHSLQLQKTLAHRTTGVRVAPPTADVCPACHPAHYLAAQPGPTAPRPKKPCGAGRCRGCNYGWVRPDIQFCTYKCAAKWLLAETGLEPMDWLRPGTKAWNLRVAELVTQVLAGA